jgi:hypothetical protein
MLRYNATQCIATEGCEMTSYAVGGDLVPLSTVGATVGGTRTSRGYGGRFITPTTTTLTTSLTLVYYTELIISGNLDCAGFDITLGAWSKLTVTGSITNLRYLTVGVFAQLSSSAAMSAQAMLFSGGGSCVDTLCSERFFAGARHRCHRTRQLST